MRHIETNWKSTDSTDIFAQAWEPDTQTLTAVICLVHGVGEHSSRYAHVADAFNKVGYILFGADLRGHGRSSGKPGHFPSIEVVMSDIDLLIEKAKARYPNLPVILYGHSLGGILVLNYGLKRKPEIKGVIATSSGLHNALEKQPAKILAAKILGAVIPAVSLPSGLDVNGISHDKAVIEKYLNDPLIHDKVSLGFGKVMLAAAKWTLQHASEFPLPLLLMHGTSDVIAFPAGSIEFAEPLGDKCKLVLIEGAFHELHNEPEKEDVFNTMIKWINSVVKE